MTTMFKMCLGACGLTHDEAVAFLGQSKPSVAKKSAGLRRMTEEDAGKLRDLYRSIVAGQADDLPDGSRRMVEALRLLRGERGIVPVRLGRPPIVDEEDQYLPPMEIIENDEPSIDEFDHD